MKRNQKKTMAGLRKRAIAKKLDGMQKGALFWHKFKWNEWHIFALALASENLAMFFGIFDSLNDCHLSYFKDLARNN
jgi:hypothetical protein